MRDCGLALYWRTAKVVLGAAHPDCARDAFPTADTVEGDWFAFIADESGTVIDHSHEEMVGRRLGDVLGSDAV